MPECHEFLDGLGAGALSRISRSALAKPILLCPLSFIACTSYRPPHSLLARTLADMRSCQGRVAWWVWWKTPESGAEAFSPPRASVRGIFNPLASPPR